MGTWSISPQVEGVSIDANGKLTYPPNLTETTFTVKYDDGKGCSGEYVYRVPESCEKRCCEIISDPIGDTNCEGTVTFSIRNVPCNNKKA